jgi:hypothetical protein
MVKLINMKCWILGGDGEIWVDESPDIDYDFELDIKKMRNVKLKELLGE